MQCRVTFYYGTEDGGHEIRKRRGSRSKSEEGLSTKEEGLSTKE